MSNTDQQRISPPPGVVRFHYRRTLIGHRKQVRDEIESTGRYVKSSLCDGVALRAAAFGRLGAHTSAIFKHSRRYFVTKIIDETARYHDLDMTMTSAALVFRAAMKYTPSDDYLAEHYGTTGRTASSKTELLSEERRDTLIAFGESLQPVVKRLEAKMRKQLKAEKRKHQAEQGLEPVQAGQEA